MLTLTGRFSSLLSGLSSGLSGGGLRSCITLLAPRIPWSRTMANRAVTFRFMLTHKSLQALIDISKHVGFSKKLTNVIIATNGYPVDVYMKEFRDVEAAAKCIQGLEEQQVLLSRTRS